MKSQILSLAIIQLVFVCFASKLMANDADISSLFSEKGIEGTIVISSLDGTKEFVHNRERSEQRFLPASTFKILNSLIALNEKVIESEDEIIAWDGTDKGWEQWNKNQTLKTALPESCIWFYQEIAKRIGNESYLSQFHNVNYGNKKTGPALTSFWLDGYLAISVREQIEFLKRLYKNELPYSTANMELVKKLLIIESNPDFTIRAKTGWAMRLRDQHGWYVGYVEKKDEIWCFATNIVINTKPDARFRKELTFQALEMKEIL